MRQNSELRRYMKAIGEESAERLGRHLNHGELIAYWRNNMDAPEREATQRHMLRCDQCLALFRDLNDFFEPMREDEPGMNEFDAHRAWRDLRERLRNAEIITAPPAGFSMDRLRFNLRHALAIAKNIRRISFPGAAWPLAAGLFVTLGLATVLMWRERQERRQAQLQIAQLQNRQQDLEARMSQAERTAGNQLEQERERRAEAEARVKELQIRLDGLMQSQQNIPVYPIGSASIRGQQQQEDSLVSITPKTRTFMLRLDIYNPNEFPEYVVEIFDQHGQRVKKISGLKPVGLEKTLNLTLDRESLKEGKHLLRLSGRRGRTKKGLGEYSLSLSFSR